MYHTGHRLALTHLGMVKQAEGAALLPILKRLGIGMATDAVVSAAIAPRPEDRPQMAALGAASAIPILGAGEIPALTAHLEKKSPRFARLAKAVRRVPKAMSTWPNKQIIKLLK